MKFPELELKLCVVSVEDDRSDVVKDWRVPLCFEVVEAVNNKIFDSENCLTQSHVRDKNEVR